MQECSLPVDCCISFTRFWGTGALSQNNNCTKPQKSSYHDFYTDINVDLFKNDFTGYISENEKKGFPHDSYKMLHVCSVNPLVTALQYTQ